MLLVARRYFVLTQIARNSQRHTCFACLPCGVCIFAPCGATDRHYTMRGVRTTKYAEWFCEFCEVCVKLNSFLCEIKNYILKFGVPSHGLKGHEAPSPGQATQERHPGWKVGCTLRTEREKAMRVSCLSLLLPFQGALRGGDITRGVAPGLALIGPSGRTVYEHNRVYFKYYKVGRTHSPLAGRRADIKWPLHRAECSYNEMCRTVL